jgi:hypothetical protein
MKHDGVTRIRILSLVLRLGQAGILDTLPAHWKEETRHGTTPTIGRSNKRLRYGPT